MTRNTKVIKIKIGPKYVMVRTLTINELAFLDGISNMGVRYEQAAKLAMLDVVADLNFLSLNQIGEEAINHSVSVINDDELFKLTVEEFRMKVSTDSTLGMITKCLDYIPGVTFEYLTTLTYNDLIELMCLAERLHNKKMFQNLDAPSTEQQPTNQPLDNNVEANDGKNYFKDEDSAQSLAEKIASDQKYFKDS